MRNQLNSASTGHLSAHSEMETKYPFFATAVLGAGGTNAAKKGPLLLSTLCGHCFPGSNPRLKIFQNCIKREICISAIWDPEHSL